MAAPEGLRPMLATLRATPPVNDGWAWELKWDGIRALGYVEDGQLRLFTRNGNEVTHRYPELRKLADAFATRDAVLDGEIVAFDDDGRPSFQRLQQRMHVEDAHAIRRLQQEVPAVYVLFDLLWFDGSSTIDEPYAARRELLLGLGLTGASWQTPPHEVGDGATTIEVSKRFGLEGTVAKRVDSRYEPGRRSGAWVKIKNVLRQEFVVGGWFPGKEGRTGSIGSLLIGYYDDGGVLHYAGKVGSGLTQELIAELTRLFERCAQETSPFGVGRPPKDAHFVEPVLVIEAKFTEWTSSDGVRQPTFLGVRPDKDPRDVVREQPVDAT